MRGNLSTTERLTTLRRPLEGSGTPATPLPPVDVVPGHPTLQSRRIQRGLREYRLVVRRHGGERAEGRVRHEVSERRFGSVRGLLVVETVERSPKPSLTMAFLDRHLRPIWSRHHGPISSASAEFDGSRIQFTWMPHRGRGQSRGLELIAPAFDLFALPWVIAALPLRPGYAARIPCFSLLGHGFLWVTVTVLGRELNQRSGRPTGSLLVEGTGDRFLWRSVLSSRQRTPSLVEAIVRGERPWRLDQARNQVPEEVTGRAG